MPNGSVFLRLVHHGTRCLVFVLTLFGYVSGVIARVTYLSINGYLNDIIYGETMGTIRFEVSDLEQLRSISLILILTQYFKKEWN